MARVKTSVPRRNGVCKPVARPHSSLHTAPARSSLSRIASFVPTYIFTASTGIRGEVLRLSPSLDYRAPSPIGRSRSSQNDHITPLQHTHVFFLPGNPGVIEFYRRWIFELAERLPFDVQNTTTIHAVGLPGHDVRELNDDRVFLISDHCEYVKSYMQSAHVSPPIAKSRVILIGHSYGAYLSLRVLNIFQDIARQATYIMLMPAIWEMGACRSPEVRMITSDGLGSILQPIAAAFTNLLPTALRQWFISRMNVEEGSEAVISRLMDGCRISLYNNILSLARREVIDIHDPMSEPSVAHLDPRRVYLFWTDNDIWCNEDSVRAIKNTFGDLTVQHAGSKPVVNHAFCLNLIQMQVVARTAAIWITESCRT